MIRPNQLSVQPRQIVGFIFLIGIITIGIVFINLKNTTPQPIPQQTLTLALAGIEHNNRWQPFTQTHNQSLALALVPAGCFEMGSTDEQLTVAKNSCDRFYGKCQIDFTTTEQPVHKVCFAKPYWIGATEITNSQYGSSSQISEEMYRGPDWARDTVTWAEALAFCQNAGLRLPTEAEWEYAARGPDALIYPWGNEYEPTYLIAGMLAPDDVGQLSNGQSWVGAYDLSGSMLEWVSDWYAPYAVQDQVDPQGPADGEQRIVRGGSWFSFASYLVRTTQRIPQDPDFTNGVTGFRCAGDFE